MNNGKEARWMHQFTMFSPMRLCSPDTKLTRETVFDQYEQRNLFSGKHSKVRLVVKSPIKKPRSSRATVDKERMYAIKEHELEAAFDPTDMRSRAARELKINEILSGLFFSSSCINFCILYDFIPGSPSPGESMLYTIHENAGFPLSDEPLSDVEYLSVWFQVLYALYVSGKRHGFSHHDFHIGNIKIRRIPKLDVIYLDHEGDSRCTDGWIFSDIIVKIYDFGLSRIEDLNGDVIYNTGSINPYAKDWAPQNDLKDIQDKLKKLCPAAVKKGASGKVWKHFLKKLNGFYDGGDVYIRQFKLLLNHPLFAPLHVRLEELDLEKYSYGNHMEEGVHKLLIGSSQGFAGIPKHLRDYAIYPLHLSSLDIPYPYKKYTQPSSPERTILKSTNVENQLNIGVDRKNNRNRIHNQHTRSRH